ncbi:ATP cone domain-containing protein [Deefgea sp. CFH1-16]|uniref:ATP cone domain-containing protein n=1 Tax=Deefgea sp. CFH1-16 TaxID=2675457 RepID=UPI001FFC807A|nr:ATP cone domain-containing protein [Deefgea sp. CFH1-16]
MTDTAKLSHITLDAAAYANYKIIRRNGSVVAFEPSKISVALSKAFIAVQGSHAASSAAVRDQVHLLTDSAVSALMRRKPEGGAIHIEDIQDQVELALMRSGEHDVARAYVLYRSERQRERAAARHESEPEHQINVLFEDGSLRPLDLDKVKALIASACTGLEQYTDQAVILAEMLKNVYDGVSAEELRKSAVLAARTFLENDPAYGLVTARLLLLNTIRREVLGAETSHEEMAERYATYFPQFIKKGIAAELLDEKLGQYDLSKMAAALDHNRDYQFGYLGLQTLYDRYFLHINDQRIELPQVFFMRVAMGLALNEVNREERAIEFYNVLSSFDFMSSTPTLFNSGTRHSQMSSCYLTTVPDDLDGIFEALKENALLSKFCRRFGQ